MTVDPARWQRVRELFTAALDLEQTDRSAFLAGHCGADDALRSEVEALLESHDASGPMDRLVAELAPAIDQVHAQAVPAPGRMIAHYTILDVLGAGGMGIVYRARDEQLHRLVALKFLPPHRVADAALKRRFLTEARAVAALDHPNVCTIYEIGETAEGQLYIAMALYGGETLHARLRRARPTLGEALKIAREIAGGLAAAHDRGIVHRDVKPSNVMILADGRIKILDFGVAKVRGLTATATGEQMGTLAYMSPEQIAGEGIDQRSDVWALGVVLYEMLTGRIPPAYGYVPPSESRRDLPPALDDLLAIALARVPERRYPSMSDLIAALDAIDVKATPAAAAGRSGAADDRTATMAPLATPTPERRRAAVLVSLLSQHEALVERLDPAELDEVAAAVRAAASEAAHRNGGLVNQSQGDEIVALFGIPAAHEDDELRAVKAALEMHTSVRAIRTAALERTRLSVTIQSGIDAGSLVAQRLRDGERRYSIAGLAAQTAARLAAAAEPDAILISSPCHAVIGPFVVAEPVPPVAVRPGSAPVAALRVLSESGIHTRLEAADRSALTPFTGRTQELSSLEALVAESRSGRGRIAVVVGDAGIGKSRIIHELRERLRDTSTRVITGRCRSYSGISAYVPIVDVLRDILGVRNEDPVTQVVTQVRDIDRSLEPLIPFYLHLLSMTSDEFAVPRHLHGEHLHVAMLDAVAALLIAVAQRAPLLLLFEDWHWADDASRDVLHRISEVVESHSIAVVVTTRPEARALAELARLGTVIHLEALQQASCTVLLQAILRADRISEDLVRRLLERTGGNPFFLEQVAHSLREEGALLTSDGDAVQARDLDSVRIPATVQAVIRARLDRLDGDAREVLRVASAIGREFSSGLLAAVAPEHIDTARALERLRAASLIQQTRVVPDPVFRFKHVLTQEVAYDSLLEHQRKTTHEAIGRGLERQTAAQAEEHAGTLAHHFSHAEAWPQAVHYGRRATDRLVALSQYPNAVAMLEQLRTWIGHLDDDERRRDLLADILLQQERLCETLGQRRRQQQIITELVALLAPRGASSRLAEAYLRQGDLLTLLKQFDAAERALNTALRLSREGGDQQLERSALRSLGLLRWHQGRHVEALAMAEQALEFDRAFGDESNILADMSNIGNVLRGLGEFDRARAILEDALAMPAVEHDPSGHSVLLHNLASVHRACGDLDAALECLLRADAGMQKLMLPVHRSFHLTTIAHIRLQQGNVPAALRTYQQAVDLSRRGYYTEALAEALRLLGEVQFGIGENAAAAGNLSEAAGLFAQLENTASQTEVLAKAALARERIGEWREAYDNWRAVLELRQALGDPAGDLEAREGLARATRHVDPDAAIASFEQALTLATVLSAHPRRLAMHNTLGILHWERQDFEAAFRHYDTGLRICRQIGDRAHEGLMLNCLGLALTRLQRYDEARTVLEESVAVNRATSERLLEAHALTALADVSLRLNATLEARQLLEAALTLRAQLNDEAGCDVLRRRLEELQPAAG